MHLLHYLLALACWAPWTCCLEERFSDVVAAFQARVALKDQPTAHSADAVLRRKPANKKLSQDPLRAFNRSAKGSSNRSFYFNIKYEILETEPGTTVEIDGTGCHKNLPKKKGEQTGECFIDLHDEADGEVDGAAHGIHVEVDVNLGRELDADATYKLYARIDFSGGADETMFTCPVCGTQDCIIEVLGNQVSIRLPPCPIHAGHWVSELPEAFLLHWLASKDMTLVPVSGHVTQTATVKRADGTTVLAYNTNATF